MPGSFEAASAEREEETEVKAKPRTELDKFYDWLGQRRTVEEGIWNERLFWARVFVYHYQQEKAPTPISNRRQPKQQPRHGTLSKP